MPLFKNVCEFCGADLRGSEACEPEACESEACGSEACESEACESEFRGAETCECEAGLYPPVHEKTPLTFSFDRIEMLWERYPQYHEMAAFSTLDALLQDHESWQKDFGDLRKEYEENQYDRFLVQLSWADLPYRYATKKLIESSGKRVESSGQPIESSGKLIESSGQPIESSGSPAENPYVRAFMEQFADIDTDRKACFIFPESYVSQFFVIAEVCKRAEIFHPIKNLFPDDEKIHYLAVFDKRNMDDVLLMYHLLYTNGSGDLFGGYSIYDYSLPWYQSHLQEEGIVLRSPFLPDRIAKYQGSLPFYHNPSKTVYVRRNIDHILEAGYFSSELDFFLSLTQILMPFFQWWYQDLTLYEEKDGYRTDWRLARTKIRTQLTADGIIKPKWKHELTLFHAVRKRHQDTLSISSFRPCRRPSNTRGSSTTGRSIFSEVKKHCCRGRSLTGRKGPYARKTMCA